MSTFLERLSKEYLELDEKVNKLTDFIDGEVFQKIDVNQQFLLRIQLAAMKTYSNCLTARIKTI